MLSIQPTDEWKLEQGLAAAELAIRDQTLPEGHVYKRRVESSDEESGGDDDAKADDIAKEDDPNVVFAEEREGWRG